MDVLTRYRGVDVTPRVVHNLIRTIARSPASCQSTTNENSEIRDIILAYEPDLKNSQNESTVHLLLKVLKKNNKRETNYNYNWRPLEEERIINTTLPTLSQVGEPTATQQNNTYQQPASNTYLDYDYALIPDKVLSSLRKLNAKWNFSDACKVLRSLLHRRFDEDDDDDVVDTFMNYMQKEKSDTELLCKLWNVPNVDALQKFLHALKLALDKLAIAGPSSIDGLEELAHKLQSFQNTETMCTQLVEEKQKLLAKIDDDYVQYKNQIDYFKTAEEKHKVLEFTLKSELASKNLIIDNLKDDLNSSNAVIEKMVGEQMQLKTLLEDRQKELDALTNSVTELEFKYEDLETHTELENTILNLETFNKDMHKQKFILESELTEEKKKAQRFEAQKMDLEQKLMNLNANYIELENRCLNFKTQYTAEREKNKKLTEEIASLKENIANDFQNSYMELEQNAKELQTVKTKVAQLTQENEELTEQYKKSCAEVTKLQDEQNELNYYYNEHIEKLKREFKDAENELTRRIDTLDKIKDDEIDIRDAMIMNKNGELAREKSMYDEQKKTLFDTLEENKILHKNLNDIKEELKLVNDAYSVAQNNTLGLQHQLHLTQSELNAVNDEVSKLNHEIDQMNENMIKRQLTPRRNSGKHKLPMEKVQEIVNVDSAKKKPPSPWNCNEIYKITDPKELKRLIEDIKIKNQNKPEWALYNKFLSCTIDEVKQNPEYASLDPAFVELLKKKYKLVDNEEL
ncbi:desmoplakin [Hyphantria cunea granulovirus]|uniref:Desmoplakin n=1 Tax=Hyphantria cunea granulovirus TaxID=307448 RepID=A0AAE6D0D5_9BBAC|nr:desmoplakin [Hyphantria cunea granulovirus]QBQ01651.1 desmoplakin [Hyphantria cunea granulovirus]